MMSSYLVRESEILGTLKNKNKDEREEEIPLQKLKTVREASTMLLVGWMMRKTRSILFKFCESKMMKQTSEEEIIHNDPNLKRV